MFQALLLLSLLVISHVNFVLARAVPGAHQIKRSYNLPDRSISKEERALLPRDRKITPKIIIISMFGPEEGVWIEPLDLNVNVTVVGFSPIYPHAHCTEDFQICQVTTGESEINAASTISSLYHSTLFDLTKTYFIIAGIAGINPYQGTTGTAAFARYAVQVALQYEIDAREIPSNWTTGYFAFGEFAPLEYPTTIYGTEVFELNVNLRDRAIALAANVTLNDSSTAQAYRAMYDYAPANQPPTIIAGDSACSDVYYSGALLSEAFGNFTYLITNGTGVYAMTAQEDNASCEAFLRAALHGLVDFSRIVLLRTGSDFDRPPPGVDPVYHLTQAPQGGFEIALQNIFLAANPFVQDVVNNWEFYENGIPPSNYLGDMFQSLGNLYGPADFGLNLTDAAQG